MPRSREGIAIGSNYDRTMPSIDTRLPMCARVQWSLERDSIRNLIDPPLNRPNPGTVGGRSERDIHVHTTQDPYQLRRV